MMYFISPAHHQLMSQSPDLPLGGQLRILRQSSTSGLLDTMARQLKKSPGWMVFCRKNWMVFCHSLCHRNSRGVALPNCPRAFLKLKYLELHTWQEQNLLLMKSKAVSQNLEALRRKEKNHLRVLGKFQGCLSSLQRSDPNGLGDHPHIIHSFTSANFFCQQVHQVIKSAASPAELQTFF